MPVLSKKDWKLFQYIVDHPSVSLDDLKLKFGSSVSVRVNSLKLQEYIRHDGFVRENQNIWEKKAYKATDKGSAAYSDYLAVRQQDQLRVYLPMIISLISILIAVIALLSQIGLLKFPELIP